MWLIRKLKLKAAYKFDEADTVYYAMRGNKFFRLLKRIATVPAAFVCALFVLDAFSLGDNNTGAFRMLCLLFVTFALSYLLLSFLQGLSLIFQAITQLAGSFGFSYLFASFVAWLLGYEIMGTAWYIVLIVSTAILFLIYFGYAFALRKDVRKEYAEIVREEHEKQEQRYQQEAYDKRYAEHSKLWDGYSQADKMKLNGIVNILSNKTKNLIIAMKEDCDTLAASMRYTPESAAYLTHFQDLAYRVEVCASSCEKLTWDKMLLSEYNRKSISEAISYFPAFNAPEDRFFAEKYADDITDIKAMLKELEYNTRLHSVQQESLRKPNEAFGLIN